MSTQAFRALGAMPVRQFMRDYWQRKPLLIRQALGFAQAPIDWPTVQALAARDEVQARLITHWGGQWQLEQGPFERLPAARRKRWTLLVQGVDLYVEPIYQLLQKFRFAADARLDDVMVSIASDGGGVGPHWDSYDVFLLQAQGQRRWRIGPTKYPEKPPALVAGLPLKIMASPTFTDEYVLDAGDMLYLPPGWAHEGVAIGACTTLSIGFRTPTREELLQAWFADQADRLADQGERYFDLRERQTLTPGQIPNRLAQTLAGWIRSAEPSTAQIQDFVGRFLTEPKPQIWFKPPIKLLKPNSFIKTVSRTGLQLDRQTRMLYRNQRFFINGETCECPPGAWLTELVNERKLSGVKLKEAVQNVKVADALYQWWMRGWINNESAVRKA